MGTQQRIHDTVMFRISSSMFKNVSKLHNLELEQLGQRATTSSQFHGILTDLKGQLVRKSALRTRPVLADLMAERPNIAA